MAYPLDDNGNIRVDFVWGNFPLQPDEQRTGQQQDWVNESNQPEDLGWTARSYGATSDTINTIYTQYLSVGDQNNSAHWDEVDTRQVAVPSAHDIATTGYNNFPAFLPNYEGDGNPGLEKIVPNVVGLDWSDAINAMSAAGFSPSSGSTFIPSTLAKDNIVKSQTPAAGSYSGSSAITVELWVAPTVPNVVDFDSVAAAEAYLEDNGLVLGTVTTSTVGATSGNNNWVKSQTPAAGTKVDAGTAVNLVEYDYVNPGNPITAMKYNMMGMMGFSYDMILPGQIVKPSVGDRITVTGNAESVFNTTWTVGAVVNDDAYTTGSTKVSLAPSEMIASNMTWYTGGLWTLVPRVTPTSVEFVDSMFADVSVANGMTGPMEFNGPLEVHIPAGTAAYNEIMYGATLPTDNGWAGAQLNFTDIHATMLPYESNVQVLLNYKTVASSSIESGMAPNPGYIKLVLTDDQSLNYNMGSIGITGTMNIVSI